MEELYDRSVAQPVERWSPKPKVASSSLAAPVSTMYKIEILL